MEAALEAGDLERIIRAQVRRAFKGDPISAKLVLERCFGLPNATVTATVEAGESVSALVLAMVEARRLLAAEVGDAS